MARNLRRWLGFLIALSIGLLPAVVQPLTAAADSGGTLFGIAGFQDSLVRIDPTSGAETQLTDLRVTGADAQTANLVSDPISHRLYMIRTTVTFNPPSNITITDNLLTVSSRTGAILASTGTGPLGLTNLVFDPSTGTLYGWSRGANVVRVNPATGAQTLVAAVGNPTFAVVSMAIDSLHHTIYVSLDAEDFDVGGFRTTIVSVDTLTGAATRSPVLDRSVRSIAFDGNVFGAGDCCPFDLVRIDPGTGTTAHVTDIGGPDTVQPYWTATDPATHSIFFDVTSRDPQDPFNFIDVLQMVNDQTGESTLSPGLASGLASLAFEPVVVVTAASLRADVQSAIASGAINNAGVANTLLSDLDAAARAAARGNCKTANNLYQSFISDISSQSGKHVAQATAGLLADEALALIVSCP